MLACQSAQNTPEFRVIVVGSLHLVMYKPCPAHVRAAPAPIKALVVYKNHVCGHRKETIKRLKGIRSTIFAIKIFLSGVSEVYP